YDPCAGCLKQPRFRPWASAAPLRSSSLRRPIFRQFGSGCATIHPILPVRWRRSMLVCAGSKVGSDQRRDGEATRRQFPPKLLHRKKGLDALRLGADIGLVVQRTINRNSPRPELHSCPKHVPHFSTSTSPS